MTDHLDTAGGNAAHRRAPDLGVAPVAVVTGGSRGIGAACVLEAARRGHDVVLTYRERRDAASEIASAVRQLGRRVEAVRADLAVPDHVQEVAEAARRTGPVSLLVNNAGVVPRGPLEDLDPEEWHATVAVNLTAPLFLARSLAHDLRTTRGAIINVSSIAGISGSQLGVAYGASKAGLIGLTKSLARQLAPEIRVNAIASGLTENEELLTWSPEDRQHWSSSSLLGRAARPEEVATAALDVAAWQACTGQIIIVDCGRRL